VSKSTCSHKRMTDAEREQRRSAERERVRRAAEQLLTSEGWQRWVRARSMFHRYSAHNTMLLALEFHWRGIDPEPVAGFRTWLKLGRGVRKGERGIRIAARVAPRNAEQELDQANGEVSGGERGERPPRFTTVSVFSLSQTDPLPDVDQLPLEPPCEPLTGDSHAQLFEPLRKLASELGYTVTFEEVRGESGGWCDPRAKRIVVDSGQAVNGQVRTFVHELVHALGVNYQTHTRPQAEVIVDTATLIILSGAGLDTTGETIPYVAGWGETGALEAVTEHAKLIDRLARTVENAINGDASNDAATAEAMAASPL
jgi:N-terminal domain of anti-restriction factor ArdC